MRKIFFAIITLSVLAGCSRFSNRGTVENPVIGSSNTQILSFEKIELTDSSTLLHAVAHFRPNWWINLTSCSVIIADGDTFALESAEGITPDERFWMPDSGVAHFKLRFPAIPSSAKKIDYLALFSVVFQDFKLLSQPLGKNVAASEDYDRARAEQCLVKAGFGARLEQLPEGLDTFLYRDFDENGVEISGGEAQKIALARVLYQDAPFIVLDEPTAALDPEAEAEVYTKFNDIVEDKTAVYISHRLSSCRFCDEIAVFDGGRVVQQGTHDSLLEAQGKYRSLWQAQAQYYQKRRQAREADME